MAEDIAREIIAQSKGGSKMAFKISRNQSRDSSSSLILSPSNKADQKTIYHVRFIRGGKTYEIIYSCLDKACGFIFSVLGKDWIKVQLVLPKKDISECIVFSTLSAIFASHPNDLSSHIKNNAHLIDVIDVVEG